VSSTGLFFAFDSQKAAQKAAHPKKKQKKRQKKGSKKGRKRKRQDTHQKRQDRKGRVKGRTPMSLFAQKAQTAMTPAEISTQVQPFLSYPRNKMDELGWFSERQSCIEDFILKSAVFSQPQTV
jgi:hypothetical protein